MVFAVLAVLAVLVLVAARGGGARETFDTPFPRVFWTFWDDPEKVPGVVKQCMATWTQHNPGFKTVLLHPGNLKQYVPDLADEVLKHPNFNDSPQRLSDLSRLLVLARHGGYWVDASVIMTAPLSTWLGNDATHEFAAFYLEGFTKTTPVIESWFFACAPNSPFVARWRDEFLRLKDYGSVGEYVQSVRDLGVDFSGIVGPEYLAIHVANQRVLADYPADTQGRTDTLKLHKAEDYAFKHMVFAHWANQQGVERLCETMNTPDGSPFIKLRGLERRIVDEDPRLKKCILG
jgi:hypothetical protein